jgi:DNA invertase Pin-like site-specific DNA recombinase
MNTSELVRPHHLAKKAKIYIRQSSPNQVLHNLESQKLQYALRDRARGLGWHDDDIDIIDMDLGQSGADIAFRTGYQNLVSDIALGNVGVILAIEATRLGRNCTHWYQLLDLCGHHDCLIADRDGVYDPVSINGRLLLGLKGQISELELHTIRARMISGLLNKAQRGDLAMRLPTGLQRLESGIVIKDPNLEVQSRIDLIFSTLLKHRTLAQTVNWFHDQDLPIPRANVHGVVSWKPATRDMLASMVRNPAYAGAAVYGRTRFKRSQNTGRKAPVAVPAEQWRYCVHDKFPRYIDWETYQEIQAMLSDNQAEYARKQSRGIPRQGNALLQGIVYCSVCGHKMPVHFKTSGNNGPGQYVCTRRRHRAGGSLCQSISAAAIDKQVVAWFFEALSPSEINVAQGILKQCDQERAAVLLARTQQVQRLRYEAQLSERQFMKSDPDNRLVTSELERRWEVSLRELRAAEDELSQHEQSVAQYIIPADLVEQLENIGASFPQFWESGLLTWAQKKSLLRTMIDKVVLERVSRTVISVRVVWRGGATSGACITVEAGRATSLSHYSELQSAVEQLVQEGHSDQVIATTLTGQGFHSPKSDQVLVNTVINIRLLKRLFRDANRSYPRKVEGFLSVSQMAKKLGVTPAWIHVRIGNGTIEIEKDPQFNCYLFPDTAEEFAKLQRLTSNSRSKSSFSRGHQDA